MGNLTSDKCCPHPEERLKPSFQTYQLLQKYLFQTAFYYSEFKPIAANIRSLNLKVERKKTHRNVFKRHTTRVCNSLAFFLLLSVQSDFDYIAKIKSLSGGLVVWTEALRSKNFQVLICQTVWYWGKSHLTSLHQFPFLYNEDKTMEVPLLGNV